MNRIDATKASLGLLVLAILVGGAGVNYPMLDMLLGMAALGVAALLAWRAPRERLPALSRAAIVLVLLVLALPLLQLIPLPPLVWRSLPGRAVPAEISDALALATWRPLTLDVEGTIRAFLNLIPAAVLFVAALRLDESGRSRLVIIIAAAALLNAVLGIMQVSSGGSLTPYPSSHQGYPVGLFVNRNHSAVLMLMAMPLISALVVNRLRTSSSVGVLIAGTIAALTILSVVTIATTSRMALLLLPLPLGASLLLLFVRTRSWRYVLPAMLALALVAITITLAGGFERNLVRFSSLHDSRFDYWNDVQYALAHYGVVGTGFGTFVPVYLTAESLSSVSPAILNHAHNDYIEILLEGGVVAIALGCAWLALLGFGLWKLVRAHVPGQRTNMALAAAVSIVTLLVFSLVDYPLRMPAISCTFAVLCACLIASAPRSAPSSQGRKQAQARDRRTSTPTRVAALAAVAAVAFVEVQAGASASALLSSNFTGAARWAPWSTEAHEALSANELAASRPSEALEQARSALHLSPIDAVAVRSAALASAGARRPVAAEKLMQIALSLGWRDPVAQIWAIEASEQTGEPQKATERAQALFQQEIFPPLVIRMLARGAPESATAQASIDVLARRPIWRAQFVAAAAALPVSELSSLAMLFEQLNKTRAPLSSEEAEPFVSRLLATNQVGLAQKVWMGTRRSGLIANGSFETLGERAGAEVPMGWGIADEDVSTLAVQQPPAPLDGKALRISPEARSGPILSQRLLLAPGTYSFSFEGRAPQGDVVLRWELRCANSDASQSFDQPVRGGGSWQKARLSFTVPNQDCPIQTLALQRPAAMVSSDVWIDDVMLQRVPDSRALQ